MELPALLAGGIKSQQGGWYETSTPNMVAAADLSAARNATGEDQVYVDITVAAVDPAKCVIEVVGAFGYFSNSLSGDAAGYKTRMIGAIVTGGGSGSATHQLTARLINATTLRISSDRPCAGDSQIVVKNLACRWSVVEGK